MRSLILSGLFALGACTSRAVTSHSFEDDATPAPEIAPGALEEQLLRVAADYRSWGALDLQLRAAPELCRMLIPRGDSTLSKTAAEDGPHGKKLYHLYARDPAAYRGAESGAPQAHQVLVKEAFEALPYEMPGPGSLPPDVVDTSDGLFRAGQPAGLFVMLRGAAEGEEEAHWTYGTLTASGEVTAAGRIESCIRCHAEAPYGGLFGLDD